MPSILITGASSGIGRAIALQLAVHGLGATDEPDRRHPVAISLQGLLGSFDRRRMIGQAEVVVGAQIEHGPAVVETDVRGLR